jgi:hypothetical protein
LELQHGVARQYEHLLALCRFARSTFCRGCRNFSDLVSRGIGRASFAGCPHVPSDEDNYERGFIMMSRAQGGISANGSTINSFRGVVNRGSSSPVRGTRQGGETLTPQFGGVREQTSEIALATVGGASLRFWKAQSKVTFSTPSRGLLRPDDPTIAELDEVPSAAPPSGG